MTLTNPSKFSVGRPKHEKVMITTNEQDAYIGDVIVRDLIQLLTWLG